MEDPKAELETQIELEKQAIPVPEKTLEAAMKRAHAVAAKLHASSAVKLTASQMSNLECVAKSIRSDVLDTDIISNDEGQFETKVCENPEECAAAFEALEEECKNAADTIKEQKVEAARKIMNAAKKLASGKVNFVSEKKVFANVRKLIADATKLDLMKNLPNIEVKSDKPLKQAVNWKELVKFSPGIGKMSKLQDLKVQDLKNILSCLRGAKEMEENEEID